EIDFVHDGHRIFLKNLPKEIPDKILGATVKAQSGKPTAHLTGTNANAEKRPMLNPTPRTAER
ncbi:MAG: hypothetical protein J5999_08715, partial [Oscillospiraceae bacterium]|nr:hypothetical protein [Oscillospiraceae bacterium]